LGIPILSAVDLTRNAVRAGHGSVTITSDVKEMSLPNASRPSRSWECIQARTQNSSLGGGLILSVHIICLILKIML
jgi:hypothetical protein